MFTFRVASLAKKYKFCAKNLYSGCWSQLIFLSSLLIEKDVGNNSLKMTSSLWIKWKWDSYYLSVQWLLKNQMRKIIKQMMLSFVLWRIWLCDWAKIDDKLYTPQDSKREHLIDLSHLIKTKAGFMIRVKSTKEQN